MSLVLTITATAAVTAGVVLSLACEAEASWTAADAPTGTVVQTGFLNNLELGLVVTGLTLTWQLEIIFFLRRVFFSQHLLGNKAFLLKVNPPKYSTWNPFKKEARKQLKKRPVHCEKCKPLRQCYGPESNSSSIKSGHSSTLDQKWLQLPCSQKLPSFIWICVCKVIS